MDTVFTDYELLGAFLDQLIAKKHPNEPLENFREERERGIRDLDRLIVHETFESMPAAQVASIKERMGRDEEIDFDAEFETAQIDLEKITARAAETFAKNFLGGENGER